MAKRKFKNIDNKSDQNRQIPKEAKSQNLAIIRLREDDSHFYA